MTGELIAPHEPMPLRKSARPSTALAVVGVELRSWVGDVRDALGDVAVGGVGGCAGLPNAAPGFIQLGTKRESTGCVLLLLMLGTKYLDVDGIALVGEAVNCKLWASCPSAGEVVDVGPLPPMSAGPEMLDRYILVVLTTRFLIVARFPALINNVRGSGPPPFVEVD